MISGQDLCQPLLHPLQYPAVDSALEQLGHAFKVPQGIQPPFVQARIPAVTTRAGRPLGGRPGRLVDVRRIGLQQGDSHAAHGERVPAEIVLEELHVDLSARRTLHAAAARATGTASGVAPRPLSRGARVPAPSPSTAASSSVHLPGALGELLQSQPLVEGYVVQVAAAVEEPPVDVGTCVGSGAGISVKRIVQKIGGLVDLTVPRTSTGFSHAAAELEREELLSGGAVAALEQAASPSPATGPLPEGALPGVRVQ